jgi:hypothetical protein
MTATEALIAQILTVALPVLATLAAVFITQRSARLVQKQQNEAAAALDCERREHEAKLAQEARAAEERQRRWDQRLAAYSEFLAIADTLPTDMMLAVELRRDLEPIVDKQAKLWAAQFRVLLVAPEMTAKVAMMLANDVRKAIEALGNSAERDRAIRTLQRAKRVFIEAARRDLGVSEDSSALLNAYRARMAERGQGSTAPTDSDIEATISPVMDRT